LIPAFLVKPHRLPSTRMVPTLDDDQPILVNPAATHPEVRPGDRVRGRCARPASPPRVIAVAKAIAGSVRRQKVKAMVG
jgi:hypothetical protein